MKQANIEYKDNLNNTVTFTGFKNVLGAKDIRTSLGTKRASTYFMKGGFFTGNETKNIIQCFDHVNPTKTFVVGQTYTKKEFSTFLTFCKKAGTRLSVVRKEASKPIKFLI